VAALSVTGVTEGRGAVGRLLIKGVALKFGKRWLIPTFLFFPAWAGMAYLVGILVQGAVVGLPWFSNPLSLFFSLGIGNFAYMFFFVGIAEEFGWRGYALERLQLRFGALASGTVLGLIWGLWHLPLFLIPGSNQQAAGLGPYLLQIVVFSIWFTWLYNNTGGSGDLSRHDGSDSAVHLPDHGPVRGWFFASSILVSIRLCHPRSHGSNLWAKKIGTSNKN